MLMNDRDDDSRSFGDSAWPVFVVLAVVAIAALMLSVVPMAASDEKLEQTQYCSMVAAHKRDPSIGWPDFRHTYTTECTGDHVK